MTWTYSSVKRPLLGNPRSQLVGRDSNVPRPDADDGERATPCQLVRVCLGHREPLGDLRDGQQTVVCRLVVTTPTGAAADQGQREQRSLQDRQLGKKIRRDLGGERGDPRRVGYQVAQGGGWRNAHHASPRTGAYTEGSSVNGPDKDKSYKIKTLPPIHALPPPMTGDT